MKMMKKAVAFAMAAMMAVSCVGCGSGSNDDKVSADNGGKKVEIAYWNSGLGTDFLDAIIKQFNEKQSDWYVYYNATADINTLKTTFGMEDVDTVDLYMGTEKYNTEDMVPLDDVLDSTVDGEGKSIREKFDASYLEYEKSKDGHYYTLTWGGGVVSMLYNKALFDKVGIKQTPRTTSEIGVVCDTLVEAGAVPITHFRGEELSGYWTYMMDVWYAQYEGFDYYLNNFWACKDNKGTSPSQEVMAKKDGRYQVMKAMEKFITPEYVQNGANSQDHVSAQTSFLNEDIGMMVNGSWVANEMKSSGGTEGFGVMKAPVISSITDHLTTVKNDVELRNLISAIDTVTDGEKELSAYESGDGYVVNGKNVSKADWERVADARNMVSANYAEQVMMIPNYSDAIDGAKAFMKYFYSDEAQKIYSDKLHITLPLTLAEGEIDTEKWTTFEKEMYDIFKKAETSVSIGIASKHEIFSVGGATPYAFYNFIELFCANNAADRVNADQAWEKLSEIIDVNYKDWLSNIQ